MVWILLKILSDMLSAGKHVLTKEMLSSQISDQRIHFLSTALVSIPFASIGFFYLINIASLFHILIVLLIGSIHIIAGHFYFQAMSVQEPSHLSLRLRSSIVFTLIFSMLILHETLSIAQYIGCGLAFLGGMLLVLERIGKTIRFDRGMRDALMCTFFGSISITLSTYLLQHYSFWQTFNMTRMGSVIGILIFLRLRGTWAVGQALLKLHRYNSGMLVGGQILSLAVLFLRTAAIAQIGSTTMVSVLSGFSPLYVWIIAVMAKRETIYYHGMWRRLLALVMFFGTSYLMQK